MSQLLVMFSLAIIPTLLMAQTPASPQEPVTLSLRDAIGIARENSPVFNQVINDRGPADWGVRNAYADFLPSVQANGSVFYRGAGRQQFLTQTFEQGSATVGSSYQLSLNWRLSGLTLTQPGLQRAQQAATDADIDAAAQSLESTVLQNYLSVLQAGANVELQEVQVQRNGENLRLAQARYEVGQSTIIDMRQAEVVKGQSDVELLRLQQLERVNLLRLFESMGLSPPTAVGEVQLTDSFAVRELPWDLDELLASAEGENPTLLASRRREAAANWGVKAATSAYTPSVNLNAGWSGFTQQFTNTTPLLESSLTGARTDAVDAMAGCEFQNAILAGLTTPLPGQDCTQLAFTAESEAALRSAILDQNTVFPFNFTAQPFQASLSISIPIFNNFSRELQVSQARAQRSDAQLAVQQQALQVRREVAERFYQVRLNYETIAIQEQNVSSGREQLELARERYRLGAGSFFELVEAQLVAQQAEFDHINSIYAYHRAMAQLEQAVGLSLR